MAGGGRGPGAAGRAGDLFRGPCWLGLIFSRQITICLSDKTEYFSVSVSAVKSLIVHEFWVSLSFFPSQMVDGRPAC